MDLREYRRKCGFTQDQISEMSGLCTKSIYRAERYPHELSIGNMNAYLKVLGLEVKFAFREGAMHLRFEE